MSNYNGSFKPDAENNNWNLAFDLIDKGSKIIDIGCSNGNFGEALKHFKDCKVDGVEPDKGDFELAKQKLDSVYNDTIENLVVGELNDNRYDTAVFMDVIEHLHNPVDTLNYVKKILKKDIGGVVFSIPNMGHASVRLMLMKGDFEYGKTGILDNTHLHYYTEREINRVFNEAGYEVVKLTAMTVGYSDAYIRRELEGMGVDRPDQSLVDILNSNNSHVYQYVGKAVPVDKPRPTKLERKFQSPEAKRMFEESYASRVRKLEKEYKESLPKLKEENQKLRADNQDQHKENQRLRLEIRSILNSKSMRIIRTIKAPMSLFRGK